MYVLPLTLCTIYLPQIKQPEVYLNLTFISTIFSSIIYHLSTIPIVESCFLYLRLPLASIFLVVKPAQHQYSPAPIPTA